MKERKQIHVLAEMAIFVALAVVVDAIAGLFSPFKYGGSISFAMLFIFIISYRRGVVNGIIAGLAFGILQSLVAAGMGNFYFLSLPQYLLDYIVPFMVLGVAGIFKKGLSKPISFALGIALGSFLRYISHSFAGVLFWGSYAPVGMNVYFYSFIVYNLPYMAASFAFCLIIGLVLFERKLLSINL